MDIRRNNDGWIEVICGSMFAGKTEELIRRINRIKYAKKTIMLLPFFFSRTSPDVSFNDTIIFTSPRI